jgi:hypothetical protein
LTAAPNGNGRNRDRRRSRQAIEKRQRKKAVDNFKNQDYKCADLQICSVKGYDFKNCISQKSLPYQHIRNRGEIWAMHEIEPYYRWRDDYIASEDEYSPFYATEYSEFEFDKQVYNFLLHPQWDSFGSNTLYMKVLYADYDRLIPLLSLLASGTMPLTTTSCC